MPADVKTAPAGPSSLQGTTFTPQNHAELAEALDKAFDYRGDVTLGLGNGTTAEGYLANRDAAAKPPRVELYVKGEDAPRIIPYGDIRSVAFSGRDPADGKSWQAWMAKKATDRQAEAARLEGQVSINLCCRWSV